MSNANKIKSNIKEEIQSNKPTEVEPDIFRYFEYYQNLNINKTITGGGNHKKKNMRKFNNIEDNIENNDDRKKINFTNDQKGLDDNYFNDIENKRKAKLGLLMIMNKFSGGVFCNDVKNYFYKIKKSKEEIQKKEANINNEIKKTFERQKCVESFDNKDLTKGFDKFSENKSKINNELDSNNILNKNKQQFNLKLHNKNKLPKIIEENNDFYTKKKFKEDLNEDQLANLYYSIEEIEKQNNNFVSGRRNKKIKQEVIKNNIKQNESSTLKLGMSKMKSVLLSSMKSLNMSNKNFKMNANVKNINFENNKSHKKYFNNKVESPNFSNS